MKISIVAALLGLSQGVKINDASKMKHQEANKMLEVCKSVHGVEFPHESVFLQLDDPALPIAEKKSSSAPASAPAVEEKPAEKPVEETKPAETP